MESELLSKMLQDVKAVIFDMDGTLIDSMYVWNEIDEEFLRRHKLEEPPEMKREIEGMRFIETAIYFKERFQLEAPIEEIMAEWHTSAIEKYCTEVQCKPGVVSFLRYLKEAGYKLGVATSSSSELVTPCFEQLGLNPFFDVVVTGADVTHGKPDPEIYLMAAELLQVFPNRCLIFEDVVQGIQSGISAGMKTCAVYDTFSVSSDEEKRKLADYYIPSFTDLFL